MRYETLFRRLSDATTSHEKVSGWGWWHGGKGPNGETYPLNKREAQRRKAIGFIKKHGLRVNNKPNFEFQWDGNTVSTWQQHPSSIIHDLAHWLVCTDAKRISLQDFGIGSGPDSRGIPDYAEKRPKGIKLPKDKENDIEEGRASMLGILIELSLGWPAGDTLMHHSWAYAKSTYHKETARYGEWEDSLGRQWGLDHEADSIIKWLIDNKFINENGDIQNLKPVWKQS